jgi:pimeloyl-ACP methyl ester carboxylesterase
MRTMFKVACRAPWLLRPMMKAAARQVRKDPEAAARRYADDMPELDRRVLEDPAMWDAHVRTTGEALEHPESFAYEARLLARAWDVDLGAVRAPTALWVGELDPTHPPSMSRSLAERLGGAPVRTVPGAATFGLVPVFPDVLRFVSAPLRDGTPV